MIQDPEISGNDLVLEDCSGRDVDSVAGVGDDDDGASERDAAAEHDVAGDGQVVQLQDVRDGSEPLQELGHLEEVGAVQRRSEDRISSQKWSYCFY